MRQIIIVHYGEEKNINMTYLMQCPISLNKSTWFKLRLLVTYRLWHSGIHPAVGKVSGICCEICFWCSCWQEVGMQIPSIQHPFNFLAIFTFVTGFLTSLILLFSGLFLTQAIHLLSNQYGGYIVLFLPS